MGKKDTKAKEYLSNNERFADLCNAVLFNGEQVIKAESLEEKDSTEVLSVLGFDGKEVSHQQKWRDLLKSAVIKQSEDACFVLIGVENQSDVHYAMPVKNAVYDALNYGAQVKEAAKNHRNAADRGSDAEFLSGFHKGDRLTPVITITVYWGAGKWDAPRSLYEMFGEIDERLKPFIPDYRINLVIPDEIEDFGRFSTELGEVLEFIKLSADKQAVDTLVKKNEKFSIMSNESVEAINIFAGMNVPVNEKEGVTDMCKAWEEQKNEGRAEGRAEGLVEAIQQMLKSKLTENEIRSMGFKPEDIEKAKNQITEK